MEAALSRSHPGTRITPTLDQLSLEISTTTGRSIWRWPIQTATACRFTLVMVWEALVRLACLVSVTRQLQISATTQSHLQQRILTVTTKWIWSLLILLAAA